MKEWETIEDFFKEINDKENYLILRNYEDVEDDIKSELHPDIDILCENRKKFMDDLSIDYSHVRRARQYIYIAGNKVPFDIREIGDSYYDAKWEKKMLDLKIKYKDLFYIMDEENYYYSLLYHALIQKNKVSDDYDVKLALLEEKLNIDKSKDRVAILADYMRKNGYLYTIPQRLGGIFNEKNADSLLVQKKPFKKLLRKIYRLIF